jgi:predicted O-methyltransferase YrrM
MKAQHLAQRASRVPRIARDGWRYPLLRGRAQAETAAGVLAGLGFDPAGVRAYEREFDAVAPGIYERLTARAAEAGDAEATRRVAEPSPSSVEGKKLLYLAARALGARAVVETGTFNGASSTFLLRALAENGGGRLLSFDVADARDARGVPVPAGHQPGWLVPDELRSGFELVLGDLRETLASRMRGEAAIDLFFHDSLHTFRHMLFEYRAAWPRLRPGGLLVSDDVFWNPGFVLFARRHRVAYRHIGTAGAVRKP